MARKTIAAKRTSSPKKKVSPVIDTRYASENDPQEIANASMLKIAKRICNARPDDHLVSILADLRDVDIGRKNPGGFYQRQELAAPLGAKLLGSAGLSLDEPIVYPDVSGGDYQLSSISPVRYISQLIRSNTTAVMQLGSGWSSSLMQVYLARGATRSKKIHYYGGEHSRSGMICSKYLAARDPMLNFRSFHFDFAAPDVTFLERQKGHILLFTSHSIERHTTLGNALFEQLRLIPNPVTVVHIEPVGWQRDAELLKRRDANDTAFFEEIGARVAAGDSTSVSENAAWWSWRANYNTDLLATLKQLDHTGAISIKQQAFDFAAPGNVLNPSSLIHYDFVRP